MISQSGDDFDCTEERAEVKTQTEPSGAGGGGRVRTAVGYSGGSRGSDSGGSGSGGSGGIGATNPGWYDDSNCVEFEILVDIAVEALRLSAAKDYEHIYEMLSTSLDLFCNGSANECARLLSILIIQAYTIVCSLQGLDAVPVLTATFPNLKLHQIEKIIAISG